MAEICADQRLDADAAEVWRRFLRAAYLQRAETHDEPVYHTYQEAWTNQFERVFKLLKLQGDPRAAALHLKKRLAEARAFDDALPAIQALEAHCPIAVLSNADNDFLHACLDRNGLRFRTVISSEDAGAIKPHPNIFRFFARRISVDPQNILYVGDNPIPDILGPSRVGMKVAWVNRNGIRKPRNVPFPDIRVKSLTELVRILIPTRE